MEGGGQRFHVYEIAPVRGPLRPLPLALAPSHVLLARFGELDESRAGTEVLHAHSRIALPTGHRKAEPTPELVPSWPVAGRDPGDVEGQVEADDQTASVVADLQEDLCAKLVGGQHRELVRGCEALNRLHLIDCQVRRLVEEAFIPKLTIVAHLVDADAQGLRRIHGGLAVEGERPRRWLVVPATADLRS